MIDARAFGIKGDGSDETGAIQGFINSVDAARGAHLYFPSGTYRFTSTLSLNKNNLFITGDGRGLTIFHFDSVDGDAIVISDSSNIRLENFTLISFNSSSNTRTGGNGIHVVDAGDYVIRDMYILNGYKGLFLERAYTGQISHLVISESVPGGSQDGVVVRESISTFFDDVDVNCHGTGWEVGTGIDTMTLEKCSVQKKVDCQPLYGMRFINQDADYLSPRWIKADRCFMEVGDNGVSYAVERGYGIEFTDCYSAWGKNAFRIMNATDIRITGGEFFACYENGIVMQGAGNILVNGSTISECSKNGDNQYSGILIDNGTSGVRITSCRIGESSLLGEPNPQSWGVEIRAGADHYMLTGNDLTGNVSGPILDNGGDVKKVIEDNLLQ